MGPDLPVTDQPKQTRRDFATVEKSVRSQEKQDGKNLAVGEAFQSRRVVSFDMADVRLSQSIWKVVLDHLIRCTLYKVPHLASLLCHPDFGKKKCSKRSFKLLQWKKFGEQELKEWVTSPDYCQASIELVQSTAWPGATSQAFLFWIGLVKTSFYFARFVF